MLERAADSSVSQYSAATRSASMLPADAPVTPTSRGRRRSSISLISARKTRTSAQLRPAS